MSERGDLRVILEQYRVFFDPAGGPNGSLYLCLPRDPESAKLAGYFAKQLRNQSLWSDQDAKAIADEQIPAYASQLELLEVSAVPWLQRGCLLLRCEHPKFPSDDNRWAAWKSQSLTVE